MKKINVIQMIIAIIGLAIIFYNIGIATALKNLKPHVIKNGYEIELFGQVYLYED